MAELNGWMMIADPFANLVFARGGWDSVTLDAQHGLFDAAAIARTLMALSADAPRRLVRVRANDPGLIGQALDAGADGVIVPLVDGVEDARRAARAALYPPGGGRSFGPSLAALRAGAPPYGEGARRTELLAMIETREGLEAVEAIARVDGVTGLYVGPSDLGLALGLAPGSDREEPQMLDAYRRILAAARAAAKSAGIFCASPDYARRMVDLGFSLVTVTSDTALLGTGAAAAVRSARS